MGNQIKNVPATAMPDPPRNEFIGSAELAQRLSLPKSWVEDRVRTRAKDQIPHSKFGKYTRFDWGSPELAEWLSRRKVVSNSTVERAHIKEISR